MIEAGVELPPLEHRVDALHAVMYAGASGDFNPLHWDPDYAAHTGPTGSVIAHGMYAMGLASRMLTAWLGGPEPVLEIQVRFTNPWPVGTIATFGGRVAAVADAVATVELWGRRDDGKRILRGSALVRADFPAGASVAAARASRYADFADFQVTQQHHGMGMRVACSGRLPSATESDLTGQRL